MNDFSLHPHRRYNPLMDEWVLVSPQRTKRPWQGAITPEIQKESVKYDSHCYLCPGNKRANNKKTPDYTGAYVFENDFPALLSDKTDFKFPQDNDLFNVSSQRGTCRVICYSPSHSLTMAKMTTDQINDVITAWIGQYIELGNLPFINYVQIFENRGEMMGASNPHPHGQIWATEHIPTIVSKEQYEQEKYFQKKKTSLLLDYLKCEIQMKERTVYANDNFVSLIPFWAVWPYEVMIVPKQKKESLSQLTLSERLNLADMLRNTIIRYDNLFHTPFPYTLGIHQAPTDGKNHPEWQFHIHFYPPLLRSATVRKFMVGYEMMAEAQRDITPEESAEKLRSLSATHYFQS
ncbi:galactose-1-phosphate uridylyltransferase [Candidatus Gottesmanbacteria bacterium RIFCSPHIGHO2_02_FULL_39_11]|uniref:Galactose-1-phosphate uridylyltransferase n=1 Tax=Candidatus Gottesmanbacteria bacterium RIFCSPHIGHO2_02_FULL_39_11 TaxID=1798382 RepID=A0A1F5ZTD5_9BACT|nr:MAG: galactose-1-phosphate uridylyltransferase [Candidatus Gottesmanbacteria bacterium RIFCSPHIGHO2_02_FULL_39_11]